MVRTLLVGALVLGVALSATGCSDDPSVAGARVELKQRALDSAEATATAANAAFCTTASDYIRAVDRYGDVLVATAPTVGDVRTAGRDLEQPQEAAVAAAEAAVNAQQAVLTAQQELVDAQAAVASAGVTPEPPEMASPTTPAPLAPPASVTRVKEAEAEFASAVDGISDQMPLREAAERFNAAAVALEMSWLALFADAGCLSGATAETAQQMARDYTKALQRQLTDAGYYDGKVDGVYGPSTVAAVEALQQAHGLPVTGTVDKATAAALQSDLLAKGGAAAQETLASTAALQQTLKLTGFWDGPVDGTWTPALTEALKKFQKELGVPATGTVDAATVAAFDKAVRKAAEPQPTPTVTVTASPAPSGTG